MNRVIAAIKLGAFYAEYRDDGWGRAAFDPKMMVALLLYAYAVGERSSRQIERRCREDLAFRVICANRIPDHATIARFGVRHEQALAATFTQLLVLCARAGLVSVGVVALDGSPISGNASPGATRTYAAIREEVDAILGQAAEADAAEDEQFGGARGDALPAPLADRRSRLERLRRCREELERELCGDSRVTAGLFGDLLRDQRGMCRCLHGDLCSPADGSAGLRVAQPVWPVCGRRGASLDNDDIQLRWVPACLAVGRFTLCKWTIRPAHPMSSRAATAT